MTRLVVAIVVPFRIFISHLVRRNGIEMMSLFVIIIVFQCIYP